MIMLVYRAIVALLQGFYKICIEKTCNLEWHEHRNRPPETGRCYCAPDATLIDMRHVNW